MQKRRLNGLLYYSHEGNEKKKNLIFTKFTKYKISWIITLISAKENNSLLSSLINSKASNSTSKGGIRLGTQPTILALQGWPQLAATKNNITLMVLDDPPKASFPFDIEPSSVHIQLPTLKRRWRLTKRGRRIKDNTINTTFSNNAINREEGINCHSKTVKESTKPWTKPCKPETPHNDHPAV